MRTPGQQVQPAVCSCGSPHLLHSLLWGQETGRVTFQNAWNSPATQCLSLCISVCLSLLPLYVLLSPPRVPSPLSHPSFPPTLPPVALTPLVSPLALQPPPLGAEPHDGGENNSLTECELRGKGPLGWRAGSCGLLGSGGAPSPAPSASPTATRWLSQVTSVSAQQPPRQVQGLSER